MLAPASAFLKHEGGSPIINLASQEERLVWGKPWEYKT